MPDGRYLIPQGGVMVMGTKRALLALGLGAALLSGARAADTPTVQADAGRPFEVLKDATDVDVSADGTYILSSEQTYRVLNQTGIQSLHEFDYTYSRDYQTFSIIQAYTLKPNGTRIPVPSTGVLQGYGSSSEGFQDNIVVNVFFSNVEIGDQIVISVVRRQIKPWFAGRLGISANFSRTVVTHDARYALTAPSSLNLRIDTKGLDGGAPQTYGDKTRYVWEYHNDAPVPPEAGAVDLSDNGPHIRISSFDSYADVASAYASKASDKSAITPAISALADQLTLGIADRRAQAKVLYDWVSKNISYVSIVLGAGGFVPHAADDILKNRYGDCKDHVVLLEALLKSKNIPSTAALIDGGDSSYTLSSAPSMAPFDHVITYVPEFDLFADSTAALAPFGVLPFGDAGKPVVLVSTGQVARTPATSANTTHISEVSDVQLSKDGSLKGTTKFIASGAYAVEMRSFVLALPVGKENDYFRGVLGPGADGTLDRSSPNNLTDPYVISLSYSVSNAVSFPGPAALPFNLSPKPFSFTQLVGANNLPPSRTDNFMCLSLLAEQDLTIHLPEKTAILSLPESKTIVAANTRLTTHYERKDARTVHELVEARIDNPQATCTPADYGRMRAGLATMVAKLREQIIYR